MIQRLSLTRTSYALIVVAYVIFSAASFWFAEEFARLPFARNLNTAISVVFMIFSAARLQDAGFRYWRSFLLIVFILFVVPTASLFAYMIFSDFNRQSLDDQYQVLGIMVLAGISLQMLVAGFCLLFPSVSPVGNDKRSPLPSPGKAPPEDDILNWTPPGSRPPPARQDPRI
ncbi:hypothetical protein [Xanthobacter sp. KR7-225]|uniref:hypothetical protein n=1 Tax=Xanthobacter sp. KR7-225 TaxID=3156613 RepID=UPI0032B401A0